jgi:hypothetical protein
MYRVLGTNPFLATLPLAKDGEKPTQGAIRAIQNRAIRVKG